MKYFLGFFTAVVMFFLCSGRLCACEFDYARYIQEQVDYADVEIGVCPIYDRASFESEIETPEQRHWYWSGQWNALKQVQFRVRQHDRFFKPYKNR